MFAFSAIEAQTSLLLQLSELMGPAQAGLINGRFSFQSSTALIDWWFATLHGAFDPGLIQPD